MFKCTQCQHTWNWKETVKSSLPLDTAMICPHCGNKQYATVKSKKRMAIPTFLIPLPILLTAFTDWPFLPIVGIMLAIAAISFAIMPRLMELTDEEEHLY